MKAVIYARYSSDNQREESIEGQLRECGDFAARKGYTIIKTYADRAISGKKADNRPQFMQMVADSKQGGFDTIIVWKIDRFSRDKYDSVYYKNVLKKNGVSVISATEPIDDSPEGQLMESIFEGFSVYYIKDLSMKTSRGMTENVLKGKSNGGTLTYGYTIDEDKHFQIDPVKALIVADIFRRYASGESTKSILSTLKEQGFKTNHGKTPGYSFITSLLKNRRYLGEYRFNDTVVENGIPQIIDADIFEKCQRRLAENQRRPASFKPVREKYLLTGKIFRGYCGETMAGESGTSKTGVIHRYYQCRAAKNKKTCDKKRILKDFIETAVVDMALRMFDDLPLLNQIVDNCYELQSEQSANLPALEEQLAQTQTEIDNVMNAIKAGIFTATTKETLLKLEQEKETLEISIAKEKIERPILSKNDVKYWIYRFRATNIDDTAQKQQLIHLFINSIHVYDDKLVVLFNYKDGDRAVTFDEINKTLTKKGNSDNHKDYQSSPLKSVGDPRISKDELIYFGEAFGMVVYL
ncbi:recombinase RecD [Clostridia bacterium]|nr:recombinase RecD [Clostridia bacterium]